MLAGGRGLLSRGRTKVAVGWRLRLCNLQASEFRTPSADLSRHARFPRLEPRTHRPQVHELTHET
eukprot:452157-Amphidinium_carterae.1